MTALTLELLKKSHRTTTLFADGVDPKHMQAGHITEYPEITWQWTKRRDGSLSSVYIVGGKEFTRDQLQEIVDAYNIMKGDSA